MAAPNRKPIKREYDRAQIAARYLKGDTQEAIAVALGLSRELVCYDLAVLRKRWHESGMMDLNEAKSRELAKVDNLEQTYWKAWMASKQAEVPASSTFLAGVQWCIERRVKLLGLDEPVKVDITQRIQELAVVMGADPEEALAVAVKIGADKRLG